LWGRNIAGDPEIRSLLEHGQQAARDQLGIEINIDKIVIRDGGLFGEPFVGSALGKTIANDIFIKERLYYESYWGLADGGYDFQTTVFHEMYHAYQWQTGGGGFFLDYVANWLQYGSGIENPLEAPAYAFGDIASGL
jgi:hypothetical protein